MKTIKALPKQESPVAAAYRRAEEMILAKMDPYQVKAIDECRKDPKRDDHIFHEVFMVQINKLVEQMLKD